MIFPETHAKTANVITIIADEPAARPSIPSVKLAPFEIPVTIKTVIKTYKWFYIIISIVIFNKIYSSLSVIF